jgi:hypothetical protein
MSVAQNCTFIVSESALRKAQIPTDQQQFSIGSEELFGAGFLFASKKHYGVS